MRKQFLCIENNSTLRAHWVEQTEISVKLESGKFSQNCQLGFDESNKSFQGKYLVSGIIEAVGSMVAHSQCEQHEKGREENQSEMKG